MDGDFDPAGEMIQLQARSQSKYTVRVSGSNCIEDCDTHVVSVLPTRSYSDSVNAPIAATKGYGPQNGNFNQSQAAW
jgi:hypothetical protein